MQSVELISLKDLIANSTAHPLGARTMRMLNTALAATPSAVDVPPDDLFALVHKDKQAPSSTVIAAVSPDDLKNEEIKQQLNDVMMLTSFISVAASRRLYQTTYKDAPPDITTGPGAAALVKAMANAKNQVLTSALSGYLSSESLVARSFSESTTSADLHFEFLKTLFDGFNFPKATINELDSVLTSVTQTIGDLHLSWSDQSSTLDHMVFLYYFDSVMGVDVKVPKVRIYFLHIDQKSWSASIGKSSVTHFEFNMNFSDGIYTMDVTQTAKDRAKIQGLLEQWTAQNLEDLNKLLSPKAVDPSTPGLNQRGLSEMILFDNDHSNRAANLAKAVNERSASIAAAQAVIPRKVIDTTLTIWGHGDPNSFAGLSPTALRDLIVAWQKSNPAVKTVELVTCDSRNTEGGTDSFSDKLVPGLIANNKMIVKLRSLPRGGSKATWSILWAVEALNSDGYYFVSGESKQDMDLGSQVLKAAETRTTSFLEAIAVAKDTNNTNAKKGPLKYSVSGGSLTKLRDALVDVTAYKDAQGMIVAVPK